MSGVNKKKKFAAADFDSEYKVLVVYIVALSIDSCNKIIHLLKKAKIAHLKVDKAPTKVFNEYANFVDVFSLKLATKLP